MSKEIRIEGLDTINAINTSEDGTVFKGKRLREMDTFIKVLPYPVEAGNKDDQGTVVYFKELKKLKSLNQAPNVHVVKIINTGLTKDAQLPFIESEWINGPDIEELLTFPNNPIFKLEDVSRLLVQMADALAHCHSALVRHGRINSHNIRLNTDTGMYVLLNFGRLLMTDEQRKADLGNVRAPEYLAPEQLNGQMLFETDIYSLGVLLHQVLTGSLPEHPAPAAGGLALPSTSVSQQIKELRRENLPLNWSEMDKENEMNIPVWLLNTVGICLQNDPAKRYNNGLKLQEAVRLNAHKTKETSSTDTSAKAPKQAESKDKTPAAAVAPARAVPAPVKAATVAGGGLATAAGAAAGADEKEAEIKRLKALLVQKEGQLDVYKYQTADYNPDLKKFNISKPMLFAALALFALLAALAAYGFFFRKADTQGLIATYSDSDTSGVSEYDSVAGYDAGLYADDSSTGIDTAALITSLPPIPEKEKNAEKEKEDRKAESVKTREEPVRKPVQRLTKKRAASTAPTSPARQEKTEQAEPVRRIIQSEPEQPREYNEQSARSSKNARYTLAVAKAYFYDAPDVRTRRPVYLSNSNQSEFISSKDSNGFIYVVFFNTDRQITKGWLRKVDLRQIN